LEKGNKVEGLLAVACALAAKQSEGSVRSSQCYNMVIGEREGMYLCPVSDLSPGELQQFAPLIEK
jgi:hypothetical protein